MKEETENDPETVIAVYRDGQNDGHELLVPIRDGEMIWDESVPYEGSRGPLFRGAVYRDYGLPTERCYDRYLLPRGYWISPCCGEGGGLFPTAEEAVRDWMDNEGAEVLADPDRWGVLPDDAEAQLLAGEVETDRPCAGHRPDSITGGGNISWSLEVEDFHGYLVYHET